MLKRFRVRDSDPLGRRLAGGSFLMFSGARFRFRRRVTSEAKGSPLKYSPTAHICAGTPISSGIVRASHTVPFVSKTAATSQARMFTFSFDECTVSMRSMPVHRCSACKLCKPLHARRNPRTNQSASPKKSTCPVSHKRLILTSRVGELWTLAL